MVGDNPSKFLIHPQIVQAEKVTKKKAAHLQWRWSYMYYRSTSWTAVPLLSSAKIVTPDTAQNFLLW